MSLEASQAGIEILYHGRWIALLQFLRLLHNIGPRHILYSLEEPYLYNVFFTSVADILPRKARISLISSE